MDVGRRNYADKAYIGSSQQEVNCFSDARLIFSIFCSLFSFKSKQTIILETIINDKHLKNPFRKHKDFHFIGYRNFYFNNKTKPMLRERKIVCFSKQNINIENIKHTKHRKTLNNDEHLFCLTFFLGCL